MLHICETIRIFLEGNTSIRFASPHRRLRSKREVTNIPQKRPSPSPSEMDFPHWFETLHYRFSPICQAPLGYAAIRSMLSWHCATLPLRRSSCPYMECHRRESGGVWLSMQAQKYRFSLPVANWTGRCCASSLLRGQRPRTFRGAKRPI